MEHVGGGSTGGGTVLEGRRSRSSQGVTLRVMEYHREPGDVQVDRLPCSGVMWCGTEAGEWGGVGSGFRGSGCQLGSTSNPGVRRRIGNLVRTL